MTASPETHYTAVAPQRFPVAIGLGSNLGDRLANLRCAAASLEQFLTRTQFSRVYETDPLHVPDQPLFLNACCTAYTDMTAGALLDRLFDLERLGGRTRDGIRFGPRTIDLDILLYGEDVVDTPELTIPHGRLHERAFALVPLAELAPNWQHAPLRKTVAQLADEAGLDGIRLTQWTLADV